MFETSALLVNVTVNSDCPEAKYSVIVSFGATSTGINGCRGQKNVTADPLSPGETASFSELTTSLSLGPGEKYCFIVIVDGVIGKQLSVS